MSLLKSLRNAMAWVVLALCCPSLASADASILLMMAEEGRQARASALSVELAGRSLTVLASDPPSGDTELMRAASAQHAARQMGSVAAVYVQQDESGGATVRVVAAEGELVRHAPLPAPLDQIDDGTFAVVAHSVLDELTGLPSPPVTVTVQVDVHGPTPAEELSAPVPPPPVIPVPDARYTQRDAEPAATPEMHDVDLEAVDDAYDHSGFVLEGSVLFAGLAAGGQVRLSYHVAEEIRVGIEGTAVVIFTDGQAAGMAGLNITRIGEGPYGRFDFGVHGGLVFAEDQNIELSSCTIGPCPSTVTNEIKLGWTAGIFVGWAWEFGTWGMGFRLALNAASIGGDIVPAPLATYNLEFPL